MSTHDSPSTLSKERPHTAESPPRNPPSGFMVLARSILFLLVLPTVLILAIRWLAG